MSDASPRTLSYAPPASASPAARFAFTLIAPAITITAATILYWFVRPMLGDYVARVLMDVAIAAILGVSLNIVNGYTGQFSLGHAAFFAIGGYTAAGVTYYASIQIWDTAATQPALYSAQSIIFIGATIVGGIVAAFAGFLVGLPSLRLRGDYLAIVTLGFGEIVRVLLQQTNAQLYSKAEIAAASWSQVIPPPLGQSRGFINIPNVTNLFWATLFLGLCLIFSWRLKRSTFGRSMIAIRENEIAAEAMGVNVTRLKVWAFVFAAFFAGVAGSLYAHLAYQLNPTDSGIQRSIDAVIIVVLGGLGSISGAFLAAVLLTVAGEWLRDPTQALQFGAVKIEIWILVAVVGAIRALAWPHNRLKALIFWAVLSAFIFGATWASHRYGLNLGDYRWIIYALVLILVMIGRPTGLFGTSEITDLFKRRRAVDDGSRGFEVVK